MKVKVSIVLRKKEGIEVNKKLIGEVLASTVVDIDDDLSQVGKAVELLNVENELRSCIEVAEEVVSLSPKVTQLEDLINVLTETYYGEDACFNAQDARLIQEVEETITKVMDGGDVSVEEMENLIDYTNS